MLERLPRSARCLGVDSWRSWRVLHALQAVKSVSGRRLVIGAFSQVSTLRQADATRSMTMPGPCRVRAARGALEGVGRRTISATGRRCCPGPRGPTTRARSGLAAARSWPMSGRQPREQGGCCCVVHRASVRELAVPRSHPGKDRPAVVHIRIPDTRDRPAAEPAPASLPRAVGLVVHRDRAPRGAERRAVRLPVRHPDAQRHRRTDTGASGVRAWAPTGWWCAVTGRFGGRDPGRYVPRMVLLDRGRACDAVLTLVLNVVPTGERS